MPGTSRLSTRAFVALVFTAASATAVPRMMTAQPTTVTFNSLTESSPGSGTRYVGNCYSESGFTFTAVGIPCAGAASQNAFVAAGPNEPILGGGTTPSFLLNSPAASLIDVMRSGGGLFNLTSISLAPFFEANTTVLFTGMMIGGGLTMQTFTLPGTQVGFQTFTFNAAFNNLTSVRITASNQYGEPLVKLDNFATNVVPEPSTIVLSALGLASIAVISRRRRNHA